MVGEGTPAIFITFLLAIVGYFGLTTVTVLSVHERVPVGLWRGVAAVIGVHVAMVWTYRYGWDPGLAVRNGWAGFAMFHGALAMILASTVAPERAARWLIHLSFLIVTLGALGATWLYEVVAIYRIPVVLCALVGTATLARHWLAGPAGARTRRAEPA
ncbi:MAG TPA: hypothetical protein VLF66_17905 [Thermoanaerobaculia bacterium]|nr:hypothetical protein [Thermoanaerobaculia bacterium]